jgi:hypothetical protein
MTIPRILAFLTLSLAFATAARGGTFPDCDKFDQPLAYNQCLASHGPPASRALASTAATEEGGEVMRRPQAYHPLGRVHRGRMSASFVIEDAHPSHRHGKFARPQ